MQKVTNSASWRALRHQAPGTLGFVPTMGHLHAGHISLCERARRENEQVVVSIFVNPTQFNNQDDLQNYPRTLEHDCALLEQAGVDYVFIPEAAEIYADAFEVQVSETEISLALEGQFRPGHFSGVLTVVLKLLNILHPERAYFGEKDFQQFLLIEKMAKALFLPVEILACPTVRAEGQLALSSRNSRLSGSQQEQAAALAQLLQSDATPHHITQQLEALGFKVEYVAEKWGRRLAAVWLEGVRLIDNIKLN